MLVDTEVKERRERVNSDKDACVERGCETAQGRKRGKRIDDEMFLVRRTTRRDGRSTPIGEDEKIFQLSAPLAVIYTRPTRSTLLDSTHTLFYRKGLVGPTTPPLRLLCDLCGTHLLTRPFTSS